MGGPGHMDPHGPRMMTPPPAYRRPRMHQPLRYSGINVPLIFYCMNHDYMYYPEPWTDPVTGTYYQSGYYDEDGQYYENMVVNENGKCKTRLKCAYCDTIVDLEWLEGAALVCPSCGAPLDDKVSDIPVDNVQQSGEYTADADYSGNGSAPGKKRMSGCLIAVIVVVALFVIMTIVGTVMNLADSSASSSAAATYSQSSQTSSINGQDSIYVDEIGRDCEWLDEYSSYYDADTDCYFAYNENGSYPCWQYWYEDISSDFGDYGWMEYDEPEQQWYIQTDANEWEVLPSEYDDSGLWHIEE